MNWKKFLVETAVIGAATAGALLYAPAFLAAEAGAVQGSADVVSAPGELSCDLV